MLLKKRVTVHSALAFLFLRNKQQSLYLIYVLMKSIKLIDKKSLIKILIKFVTRETANKYFNQAKDIGLLVSVDKEYRLMNEKLFLFSTYGKTEKDFDSVLVHGHKEVTAEIRHLILNGKKGDLTAAIIGLKAITSTGYPAHSTIGKFLNVSRRTVHAALNDNRLQIKKTRRTITLKDKVDGLYTEYATDLSRGTARRKGIGQTKVFVGCDGSLMMNRTNKYDSRKMQGFELMQIESIQENMPAQVSKKQSVLKKIEALKSDKTSKAGNDRKLTKAERKGYHGFLKKVKKVIVKEFTTKEQKQVDKIFNGGIKDLAELVTTKSNEWKPAIVTENKRSVKQQYKKRSAICSFTLIPDNNGFKLDKNGAYKNVRSRKNDKLNKADLLAIAMQNNNYLAYNEVSKKPARTAIKNRKRIPQYSPVQDKFTNLDHRVPTVSQFKFIRHYLKEQYSPLWSLVCPELYAHNNLCIETAIRAVAYWVSGEMDGKNIYNDKIEVWKTQGYYRDSLRGRNKNFLHRKNCTYSNKYYNYALLLENAHSRMAGLSYPSDKRFLGQRVSLRSNIPTLKR